MEQADRGNGMIASLLRNPDTRVDLERTLAETRQTAAALRAWTARVEGSSSLANRLMTDEGMGQRAGRDLESLIHDLSNVAAKLDRGEGSAAKLINDPNIYDAVKD